MSGWSSLLPVYRTTKTRGRRPAGVLPSACFGSLRFTHRGNEKEVHVNSVCTYLIFSQRCETNPSNYTTIGDLLGGGGGGGGGGETINVPISTKS